MNSFLDILALPAVIIVGITSLILLIGRDWRWSIATLSIQYLGVFLLVALNWPVLLAVIKLIAGWMAGAVLSMGVTGVNQNLMEKLSKDFNGERDSPLAPLSGRFFRLSTGGMVGLVVISVATKVTDFIPGISIEQALGALLLIGIGLLQLCFTYNPIFVLLGLLTVLSGFEIIYAVVETSTLVAGLLAGVTLGISIVGAYLITASLEEVE